MNPQILKGNLDLLLLAVVKSDPAHGYAIAEALRGRSQGTLDMAEGTLYPALHRLEEAGLLASRWAEVGGRRRRVYHLTTAGRRSLEGRREEWREFSRAVNAVLEEAS